MAFDKDTGASAGKRSKVFNVYGLSFLKRAI